MKNAAFFAALAAFAVEMTAGNSPYGVAAGAAVIIALAAKDPACLLHTAPAKFWLPAGLFVALAPFFVGAKSSAAFGLPYSTEQLKTGLFLLYHAYCFTALAAYLSRNYSTAEIITAAEKTGFHAAGLRIALALSAARKLKSSLDETYLFYRLDRPGALLAVKGFPLLTGAVLRNTAAAAEEIAALFYLRNIRL